MLTYEWTVVTLKEYMSLIHCVQFVGVVAFIFKTGDQKFPYKKYALSKIAHKKNQKNYPVPHKNHRALS